MAYVPTTFVDRSVEFANRRRLTAVPGQADTFDVARAEGTVFAEGTKPDAANLNAEFEKIKTETDSINTSLDELDTKVINIDKFSTTEKVVGEWTDGKPLYEVTKDLTLTNGVTTSLGIANVDMVYIENSVPLCNSYVNSSDYQGYSISASGIYFSSTGQNSGKSHKITLRYTKTTD